MIKYPVILILMLSALSAYGQDTYVKGIVTGEDGKPLYHASVALSRTTDNSTRGDLTGKNGEFRISLNKPGKYELKISYLGYKTYSRQIGARPGGTDAGTIRLEVESVMLSGVTVEGSVPIASQSGDTTQYNVGAYKTNRDASAEDLVQKLPGVTMENGQVKAQGEAVKEVLVDGKPFMGEDPSAALKNLPSEVIDKIQVFDKQSDQAQFTGFDNGQTNKAMNIITKFRNGSAVFGKAYAGYGNDNKYQATVIANYFSGDRRLTLLAQTNNVNQQNFSFEDIIGVYGGNGGGGGRMMMGPPPGVSRQRNMGGGGPMSDFMVSQQDGISKVNSFGLNYSDTWSSKINVTGSYFFNVSSNDADKTTARAYFSDSTVKSNYSERALSNSDNVNHRFNMRFEYNIDNNNKLLIRPRFTYQSTDGTSNTTGGTYNGGLLANNAKSIYSTDLSGMNFNNEVLYSHLFDSSGRSMTIDINTTNSKNDGTGDLLSENEYYTQAERTLDSLNQLSELTKTGEKYSAQLSFNEPLAKNHMLQLNYTASLNLNESDKENYTKLTDAKTLDTSLSNTFKNDYFSNRAGLSYRMQFDSLRMTIAGDYQTSRLKNDQKFPYSSKTNQDFSDFLPSVNIQYKFTKQTSLRVNYRTSNNLPSIEQLQKVLDNSNPLQLSIGNPDLKQDYTHNLSLRLFSLGASRMNNLFFMINGSLSDRYIGKENIYAKRDTVIDNIKLQNGTQLTRYLNLNGYRSLNTFFGYGNYVPFISSNINFHGMINYSRTPSLINGIENFSESGSIGGGLILSSNISDKIDFTIGTTSLFYNVKNSAGGLQSSQKTSYFNQNTRARINMQFWDGFVLAANLNHDYYKGLSSGTDPNNLLLNVSLAKKFLADNRGEIKLSVYDALNSSKALQRNVTEFYTEDVTSNVLRQYVMLTFTYSIMSMKDYMHHDGPPPERRDRPDRP